MDILEIKNLTYNYSNSNEKVLSSVNQKFEIGKFYAIIGKSGAGKSTLLSLLAGLDKPQKGQILFKGNDIEKRRSELSLIFRDNIINPVKEYKALFALQTAYAIIVKLIACKVIDKLEYDTSTKNYSDLTKVTATELQNFLEKLEDGYVYRSSNIINLLEGDFFSWYSAKEQWDTDLWETIIKIITCIDEYSTFSFEIIYVYTLRIYNKRKGERIWEI